MRTRDVSKADVATAVIEVRLVQPVTSEGGRRTAENLLTDEYAAQWLGEMPPFELATLVKAAFADLPRTPSEIDALELEQADIMTPTDVLRAHLRTVHGRADAGELTALEAEHRHGADHAGDLPDVLEHDQEWMGWTRADIEAAVAMSEDGPDGDRGDEAESDPTLVDMDDVDNALFSERAR